jgi:hypothetical protein
VGNSRWSGSLISGGGILAAGTTYFNTQSGSAATTIADGSVQGTTYLKAGSYVKSTTYVQSGTGYVSGKGDVKQYAAGTVITGGGATCAIVATGLTTVHHVWLNRNNVAYSAATTGCAIYRPCLAVGTPGSFYPIAFKINSGGAIAAGSVAATCAWFAVGAKTIT